MFVCIRTRVRHIRVVEDLGIRKKRRNLNNIIINSRNIETKKKIEDPEGGIEKYDVVSVNQCENFCERDYFSSYFKWKCTFSS